jgi:hypothetical protein
MLILPWTMSTVWIILDIDKPIKMAQEMTLLNYVWEIFVSNLGTLPNLTEVFVVFLSPSRRILGQHFEIGQHRFLPHNFHFIIN